jgi:hypothetical protein
MKNRNLVVGLFVAAGRTDQVPSQAEKREKEGSAFKLRRYLSGLTFGC